MGQKGGAYERELCRRFSVWWSGDPEVDDLFWRASQSGGRATTRARKGKRTVGHCGDVAATSSEGELFTRLITVEAKRGYNGLSPLDLLDKPPTAKTVRKGKRPRALYFHELLKQAIDAAGRAGTPFWLLVHRRDKRLPVVYMPATLRKRLLPFLCSIRVDSTDNAINGRPITVYGCLLDDFLDIDSSVIKTLAEDYL